jgi:hypothetical protein
MKNSKKKDNLRAITRDGKRDKKDIFEDVYTQLLNKVNNNLGIKTSVKEKPIESVVVPKEPVVVSEVVKPIEPQTIPIENPLDEFITVDPKQEAKAREVQSKVSEYNKKLIAEMLTDILNEEREKDKEREKVYQNTKDPLERKNLEKQMALDRAQSSERINKIKDEINEKVKQFEKSLF